MTTTMPASPHPQDIASKLQLYGVLQKKPVGQHSNKWAKRFFVIRDGFLFYYPDSERKDFEKKPYFNTHPKGAIPLGGCKIEPKEEQGHPFSLHITTQEIDGIVVMAAESEWERDKWLDMLQQSCRITWKNAQLGDAMIQQLESQGLQMAQEKQNYYDALQVETLALRDQKERTQELERIKKELEEEKKEMETLASELRNEYDGLKDELEDTTQAMNSTEEERQRLNDTTKELQEQLESLRMEKEKTIAELHEREELSQQLSEERKRLSQSSFSMETHLQEIEEQTQKLLEEKADAEARLQEKELQALELEEEKELMNKQAEELKETIKEIAAQKELTEQELKMEIIARLDAERRLTEAESSLRRLEQHVGQVGVSYTEEEKSEMMFDVKTLRSYFENLAVEQKYEADKPAILRRAVTAKKHMRRANTLTRKHKAKSTSGSDPDLSRTLRQSNPSTAQLRRAATFMCRDPRIRTGIVNAIQAIREEKPAEPQDT